MSLESMQQVQCRLHNEESNDRFITEENWHDNRMMCSKCVLEFQQQSTNEIIENVDNIFEKLQRTDLPVILEKINRYHVLDLNLETQIDQQFKQLKESIDRELQTNKLILKESIKNDKIGNQINELQKPIEQMVNLTHTQLLENKDMQNLLAQIVNDNKMQQGNYKFIEFQQKLGNLEEYFKIVQNRLSNELLSNLRFKVENFISDLKQGLTTNLKTIKEKFLVEKLNQDELIEQSRIDSASDHYKVCQQNNLPFVYYCTLESCREKRQLELKIMSDKNEEEIQKIKKEYDYLINQEQIETLQKISVADLKTKQLQMIIRENEKQYQQYEMIMNSQITNQEIQKNYRQQMDTISVQIVETNITVNELKQEMTEYINQMSYLTKINNEGFTRKIIQLDQVRLQIITIMQKYEDRINQFVNSYIELPRSQIHGDQYKEQHEFYKILNDLDEQREEKLQQLKETLYQIEKYSIQNIQELTNKIEENQEAIINNSLIITSQGQKIDGKIKEIKDKDQNELIISTFDKKLDSLIDFYKQQEKQLQLEKQLYQKNILQIENKIEIQLKENEQINEKLSIAQKYQEENLKKVKENYDKILNQQININNSIIEQLKSQKQEQQNTIDKINKQQRQLVQQIEQMNNQKILQEINREQIIIRSLEQDDDQISNLENSNSKEQFEDKIEILLTKIFSQKEIEKNISDIQQQMNKQMEQMKKEIKNMDKKIEKLDEKKKQQSLYIEDQSEHTNSEITKQQQIFKIKEKEMEEQIKINEIKSTFQEQRGRDSDMDGRPEHSDTEEKTIQFDREQSNQNKSLYEGSIIHNLVVDHMKREIKKIDKLYTCDAKNHIIIQNLMKSIGLPILNKLQIETEFILNKMIENIKFKYNIQQINQINNQFQYQKQRMFANFKQMENEQKEINISLIIFMFQDYFKTPINIIVMENDQLETIILTKQDKINTKSEEIMMKNPAIIIQKLQIKQEIELAVLREKGNKSKYYYDGNVQIRFMYLVDQKAQKPYINLQFFQINYIDIDQITQWRNKNEKESKKSQTVDMKKQMLQELSRIVTKDQEYQKELLQYYTKLKELYI